MGFLFFPIIIMSMGLRLAALRAAGDPLQELMESKVAQWIKCLPSVQEVMGSIPVRDSEFSLSLILD